MTYVRTYFEGRAPDGRPDMYVRMSNSMYVCAYVCMHVCTGSPPMACRSMSTRNDSVHTHTYTHTYVHAHVRTRTYVRTYMRACMHTGRPLDVDEERLPAVMSAHEESERGQRAVSYNKVARELLPKMKQLIDSIEVCAYKYACTHANKHIHMHI